MRFLAPLGLLGLLSIIALIIIYILKPKYQDRQVSSSFIWKLSLKYKRKKMPFEWLKSSLLLILQVLILLIITAILTKPHYALSTNTGEKVVILDTSASMMAVSHGKTRLERAINEIENLAMRTIENNDKFSIILAGQEAKLLVNRSESLQYIKSQLSNITSNYSISNIEDAMLLTENIIKANNIAEIIYYTSNDYNDPGMVRIRNMSQGETNASVLSFKGERDQSGNYIFITEVVSYGKDLFDVVLELRIDDNYKTSTVIDKLEAGIVSTYVWRLSDVNEDTYDVASVHLKDIDDDFMYDNSLEFFSSFQKFRVQIVDHNIPNQVDSTKEFVTRALQSLNRNFIIDQVSNPNDIKDEGYDLYIYSKNVPDVLPIDGAVWIFDPLTLPTSIGTLVGDISVNNISPVAETSSVLYEKVMQQVATNNITISRYKQLVPSNDFEVLMSYQSDPILMSTTNVGPKITIFSFDLAYSNLPILFLDFPILIRNLSNYSMVETIDDYVYDAGLTIPIYPHPAAVRVDIENNDGVFEFGQESIQMLLSTLGRYKITQVLNTGAIKTTEFYVRIPASESNFDDVGDTIYMPLVPSVPGGDEVTSDLLDLLPYLAAFLILLVVIEWGVQYREQY